MDKDLKFKLRPLYLAQILYERTDEDHYLTTAQLMEIQEVMSSQKRYNLISREYDIAEIKLLPYWKAYLLGGPDTVHLHSCLDGPDCGGIKGKGYRARNRRTVHIMVAHVWLEHLRDSALRPGSGNTQVFPYIKRY